MISASVGSPLEPVQREKINWFSGAGVRAELLPDSLRA
jgi:hypothetical protein